MTNEMIENHLYTSDEKLKWFGYGEWIEEPDEVFFQHNGIHCKIERNISPEPYSKDSHVFGGHLCGYICIPIEHRFYQKDYDDIHIDVHGGLTYSRQEENGFWIGFDCAHSDDLLPSMYKFKTAYENETSRLLEFYKKYPEFIPTYKNIAYCINECKSMADQLIVLSQIQNDIE